MLLRRIVVAALFFGLQIGSEALAQESDGAAAVQPTDDGPHPLLTPRALIGWTGLAGVLGGTAWFFVAGDSLGAGDPAGLMIAGGGIALAGVGIGRTIDGTWSVGSALPDVANTPTAELGLSPGGSVTIGENDPYGMDGRIAPRFGGKSIQLIAAGQYSGDLGESVAVDSRAEHAGEVVFRSRQRRGDLRPELRWRRPGVDLQLIPMHWSAVESVTHADGSERGIRREAMVGAAGLRLHVTARQRLLVAAGPRFDALSWTEQGSWAPREWTRGPIYGAVGWQFDLPGVRHIGTWQAVSQLQLGYEHTNFAGSGFDIASVTGFFGPVAASWDVRLRAPNAKHALQASIDATVGTGGGIRVAVGWAAPSARRATQGDQ